MIRTFGIHLKVKDIAASLFFYTKFGLKPVFAYGDKNFLLQFDKAIPTAAEKYHGVVFDINGSPFEIADGHLAVKHTVFQENIKSSKISAMFYVESVDQVVTICKENSFEIAVYPRKFPWGTNEIVVKDPDGFVLVFIEKIQI